MQARVLERVRKWDEFFQFDANYKSKSFFYAPEHKQTEVKMIRFVDEEPLYHMHKSFDSQDFEELRKMDERLF
jgi:hypothetical protein